MNRMQLAGFGKVDITPPLSIPYLSFHPRQTPFEGVHDRLFARALAVELVDDSAPPSADRLVGADRAGKTSSGNDSEDASGQGASNASSRLRHRRQ